MPWNIVGHERAVRALQRALATGTLAHAYILVGPPRIGKRTLALELAQALNCEAPEPGSRPCGQCPACRAIAGGRHPDVLTITRASPLAPGEPDKKELPRRDISIEQVRELQRAASLSPFAGRARVYLIDAAEDMSREAANCLLKTLEEPPASVLLLLLCSNAIVMLPTVLSRCQRLELGPLPASAVAAALSQRWGAAPERAAQLAQASEGRLGWAVEALHSPALLEEHELLQKRLVEVMAGSRTQRLAYAEEVAALWAKDHAAAEGALEAWERLFRGLLRVSAGQSKAAGPALLQSGPEGFQGLGLPALATFLRSLAKAREQLRANVSPRLALDLLFLRLPAAAGASPLPVAPPEIERKGPDAP